MSRTPQKSLSKAPGRGCASRSGRTCLLPMLTASLKICLQFPDQLLHDSVPVFKALRARLQDSVELYVMADTTYGRCGHPF